METDSTVDVTEVDQESTSPAETSQEVSGDNPAWEPLLALVDPRTHEAVKGHLKSWDDNYRGLETKYKTLESTATAFAEFSGIDPDEIRVSLQIAQNIANNPKEVAKILAESTGMTLAEAKEVIAEEKKEAEPDFEFSEDDDPRLVALAKKNAELEKKQQEFFSQFEEREVAKERQAEEVRYNKQIDLEMAQLVKNDPGLATDQDRLDNLFSTAAILAEKGHKTPLQTAYAQQRAFIEKIQKQVAPAKPTPLFMPTNGNAPPAQTSRDLTTREGKRAAALEVIAALNGGQG